MNHKSDLISGCPNRSVSGRYGQSHDVAYGLMSKFMSERGQQSGHACSHAMIGHIPLK